MSGSNIAELLILSSPAHRPRLYSGYPGLSPSFPASIVCIVYLSLLADTPAHALDLTLKTTVRANNGCAPSTSLSTKVATAAGSARSSMDSAPSRPVKFPLKRRTFQRSWTLWRDGQPASEAEQEAHDFDVRYVSPKAVYAARQDLDEDLRAQLDRAEERLRMHDEINEKPSLYPVRTYPAANHILARGTHLFYFSCPMPDLPPTLDTAYFSISHTLTARLHVPQRVFPYSWFQKYHVERADVPLRIRRYNDLDSYLREAPMRVRSAPDAPIAFEVSVPNRILVPYSFVPVTVRLAPNFDHDELARGLASVSLGGDGSAVSVRAKNLEPSVAFRLEQVIIITSWRGAGGKGSTTDRRHYSTVLETVDKSPDRVVGDLWNKTITLQLPMPATAVANHSYYQALYPSMHLRLDLTPWSQRPGVTHDELDEHVLDSPLGNDSGNSTPRSSYDSDSELPIPAPRPHTGSTAGTKYMPEGLRKALASLSGSASSSRAPSIASVSAPGSPGESPRLLPISPLAMAPRSAAATSPLATSRPIVIPTHAPATESLRSSPHDDSAIDLVAPPPHTSSSSSSWAAHAHHVPPMPTLLAGIRPAQWPAVPEEDPVPPPSPHGRPPPSYHELDVPQPTSYLADEPRVADAEQMEVRIRHELVVTGTVGKRSVEVRIPVTIDDGNSTTRADILRHVCA
ncbi:hypothetical protein GGF32_001171 [Allomyces javanicus]|nr:hypothetical protein GGF32_001171 [Allomyces javanicus]